MTLIVLEEIFLGRKVQILRLEPNSGKKSTNKMPNMSSTCSKNRVQLSVLITVGRKGGRFSLVEKQPHP